MNNAWLIQDQPITLDYPTVSPETIEEEVGKMAKILEAVREVQKSRAWSTLKDELFKSLAASLLTELTREARRDTPDVIKLARLGGQLKWAEKYADLSVLEAEYKARLSSIRRLHGQS